MAKIPIEEIRESVNHTLRLMSYHAIGVAVVETDDYKDIQIVVSETDEKFSTFVIKHDLTVVQSVCLKRDKEFFRFPHGKTLYILKTEGFNLEKWIRETLDPSLKIPVIIEDSHSSKF